MSRPFRPRNAALLMALSAIYPMVAYSAAGVAQFTVGDVNVRRGAAAVPLTKGQAIESGDSIVTGGAGQAQLRFSDGGLVSLAPNTQFNITNYADANDPGKDSFAVNLFRGGMRAITGLIGKRNRENYKVTTNTATIGIRGSAFSANIDPTTGALTVAGEQDAIQVCTQAGCVDLTVGEIVRINNSGEVPARTALNTNLPPLSRLPQTGAIKNQPDFEIPVTGINGEVAAVSALFSSWDYFPYNGYIVGGLNPSTGIGTFVNSLMTKHVSLDNNLIYDAPSEILTIEQIGSGSTSFGAVGTATDPALVGWGYWDAGRVTVDAPVAANNSSIYDVAGMHYIFGRLTPYEQMPSEGYANFALVGGSNPTATMETYSGVSRIVGTLVGAGMNVNFNYGLMQAYVDTRFVVNNSTVNVRIADYGYVDGNEFYSNGGTGSSGEYYGFFTGPGATRAGMIYWGYDGAIGDVNGAAVFVRSGSSTPVTDLRALFIDDTGNAPSYDVGGHALFNGSQLVMMADDGSFDQDCYCGVSTLVVATAPVSSFQTVGTPADNDFIGWGYWAKGVSESNYSGSSLTGVHYIVGKPTTNMPFEGTASYAMIGGTAPTATYAGQSIVGTLLSASLQVDFGLGSVQASVATQFTKNNVTSTVVLNESANISGNKFQGGGLCAGNVRGLFIGDAASRAGMVYTQQANQGFGNLSNPSNLGVVQGAVALQRGAITPPPILAGAGPAP